MADIITLTAITKIYKNFTAVNGVNLQIREGEILGLIGHNGAGKTTTLKMMVGLLAPTSGEVRVAGLDFSDGGGAIKSKVGYMSQRFTLYNDLTVSENLAFAAGLRKLEPEAARRRTEELLGFIGFDQPLSAMVRDLPGGQVHHLPLPD